MRKAGEYVVGIFHESIMAIQSRTRRRGRGFVVSTRADAGMRFIRTFIRALSDVLHLSHRNPRCFLSVSGQLDSGESESDCRAEYRP